MTIESEQARTKTSVFAAALKRAVLKFFLNFAYWEELTFFVSFRFYLAIDRGRKSMRVAEITIFGMFHLN